MRNTAIILAAGDSIRFSNNTKKQFSEIDSYPVVWHSIQTFLKFDPDVKIILVLNQKDLQEWSEIYNNYDLQFSFISSMGGESRSESVMKALEFLERDGKVFIHDASRPCISIDLLNRLSIACDEKGNAVPIIESSHSLRYLSQGKYEFLDRNKVVQVQTPQCFKTNDVLDVYHEFYDPIALDDSQIMACSGMEINYISGEVENIKITYSFELDLASVILSKRENG